MKKGFTLIELLAVIIILGIILAIATPLILNVINNSRKESIRLSAEHYVDAVNLAISKDKLNNPRQKYDGIYEIEDNGETITREDGLTLKVDYSGKGLQEGQIEVRDGKVVDLIETPIDKYIAILEDDKVKLEPYVPREPTYLMTGQNFNAAIKTLANNTNMAYGASETTIKSISFHSNGKLPTGYTKETLEALSSTDVSNNSDGSIKAYYDNNGNIYVYSEGKITANADSSYMFQKLKGLTNLDLSNFNTSNVTGMDNMFADCISLTTLDLSKFDTTTVTNMGFMFSGSKALTTLDLSNFNTSKVTTMSGMFQSCSSLITLDLSNFNTSNVTVMDYMFYLCTSLTTLDVSNWNTSKVRNMQNMFGYCKALRTLDLSSFDISNVNDMMNMFTNCTNLTDINLSSFDTSNVAGMRGMFSECTNLTTLDLRKFNMDKVTGKSSMFFRTTKLTTIKVDKNNANIKDQLRTGTSLNSSVVFEEV